MRLVHFCALTGIFLARRHIFELQQLREVILKTLDAVIDQVMWKEGSFQWLGYDFMVTDATHGRGAAVAKVRLEFCCSETMEFKGAEFLPDNALAVSCPALEGVVKWSGALLGVWKVVGSKFQTQLVLRPFFSTYALAPLGQRRLARLAH